jgi:hypothetical protein
VDRRTDLRTCRVDRVIADVDVGKAACLSGLLLRDPRIRPDLSQPLAIAEERRIPLRECANSLARVVGAERAGHQASLLGARPNGTILEAARSLAAARARLELGQAVEECAEPLIPREIRSPEFDLDLLQEVAQLGRSAGNAAAVEAQTAV